MRESRGEARGAAALRSKEEGMAKVRRCPCLRSCRRATGAIYGVARGSSAIAARICYTAPRDVNQYVACALCGHVVNRSVTRSKGMVNIQVKATRQVSADKPGAVGGTTAYRYVNGVVNVVTARGGSVVRREQERSRVVTTHGVARTRSSARRPPTLFNRVAARNGCDRHHTALFSRRTLE